MNAKIENNVKKVMQTAIDFDTGLIVKEECKSFIEEVTLEDEKEHPKKSYKTKKDRCYYENLLKLDYREKEYFSMFSQTTISLKKSLKGGWLVIEKEPNEEDYIQKFDSYAEALEHFGYWIETADGNFLEDITLESESFEDRYYRLTLTLENLKKQSSQSLSA